MEETTMRHSDHMKMIFESRGLIAVLWRSLAT